jgi:hypothetical protein
MLGGAAHAPPPPPLAVPADAVAAAPVLTDAACGAGPVGSESAGAAWSAAPGVSDGQAVLEAGGQPGELAGEGPEGGPEDGPG